METLDQIKSQLSQTLKNDLDISYPPSPELGDLSLALFGLAKASGKNPIELAQETAEKLNKSPKLKTAIKEVRAVGPYVNIFLDYNSFTPAVIKSIKKDQDDYGRNQSGKKAGVMIEYSNGNTHKELHIGHLRNICLGDTINRLLDISGHRSLPVSYINDFGIHVAKTLWYLKNNQKEYQKLIKSTPKNRGYLLGSAYKEATAALAENETAKEAVGKIMQEIESQKGENYQLWQKTRDWSIKYFQSVYQDLGVKFKKTFYESEVITSGLKTVKELVTKGVLKKSEGAIIADLEKYNLGVLPIIRSDGTALYPVADLALAVKKFRENKIQESIYVVDVRQSLYFKQLFKILQLMGYEQKMTHLAYDFVTLPSGMMSSRSGNVITYHELIAQAKELALTATKDKHPDWSQKKITQTASELAFSTIKFEMLKVSAQKTITFDIKEALKFDGYTATYLQYTHARLMSIGRKAPRAKSRLDYSQLSEPQEKHLLFRLAQYPETIRHAKDNYDPSEISKYLFELCQLANDYYHAIPIIKSAPKTRDARLELIAATRQIIKNGLELLGIKAINEI